MEGNDIRITIIGTLIAIQVAFGCPAFLHYDYAYISLLHHFFHANIFHLAANSLSIWLIFGKGKRYGIRQPITAFIIASISWFCSSADVVGISNIIFAILGLRTPPISSDWWRKPPILVFFAVTILMALLPQVSATTHIVSFVLGCLMAGAERTLKKIRVDFSRASYHQ